jgi:hypothetical protein
VRAGTYGPPTFFNWDWGSQDAPIQDDVCLDEYNVAARMDDFVKACRELANVTRGTDIMLTMGTDFQYSNAFVWCGAGGPRGRPRSPGWGASGRVCVQVHHAIGRGHRGRMWLAHRLGIHA